MSDSTVNLQALLDEGKDIIQKADGSIVEALELRADYCIISYVDCSTKQTEVVTLKKGDTFYYGDWDGTKCVRKTYTCK